MVRVAGKTVRSPCHTWATSKRFRDGFMTKRYINSRYFTLLIGGKFFLRFSIAVACRRVCPVDDIQGRREISRSLPRPTSRDLSANPASAVM